MPNPDLIDQPESMHDVRENVDAIDRALVDLLVQRFAMMDAAARIKPDRGAVRDEARKAEVIENAASYAAGLGLPSDIIAALWDQLVESSIAYEFDRFDER
ncbi:MAG: chorismate mutase [Novosphingopyxis baekryungensis]|jgi:isochorismate pyruvate lyase|nr:chorismate mutase [Novosphingopyxis baekryungensis]